MKSDMVAERGATTHLAPSAGHLGNQIMGGLIHALLLAGGLVMLFPFVWVISTSLKLPGAAFEWPPNLIPRPVVWSNYVAVFQVVPFLRFALNTVVITVVAMAGNILSSSLVGYAFARLRFPGREVLFLLCLSTMMLPHIVTIIPTFILFRYLGWIDTFLPLTVPAWFGGSPFFIFLARQFMRTIPPEYDEAARIDGAGSWRIWWTIILPSSRPLLATIAIFSFNWSWNDFMGPLIFLNTLENFTLALGLRFLQGYHGTEWTLMMAGAALMTVPMILIFFFAQRYFIEGMVLTGLAGR